MKLVTYKFENKECVGILENDVVKQTSYKIMNELIDEVGNDFTKINYANTIPLENVELMAPIPCPRQDIICLGINYKSHAEEAQKYDEEAFKKERPIPIYFSKRVNRAIGTLEEIDSHPGLVEKLDYEAELAVVIAKTCKNVKKEEVQDYIFGYTIINDVSARTLQTTHKQWYFGKSLDTFTPMGPCVVTVDEISFPPELKISSRVNGEIRQDSNTNLLITGIGEIIEELSSGMTLLPGTIIATGTPAGVGMGFNPPKFLEAGDLVECEIEKIGILKNKIK